MRGVFGVDLEALFLVMAPRQRRTYSPPASGRRYCLRHSCARPGRPAGSLCGNKDTACKLGECSTMEVERGSATCYTLVDTI